MGINDDFVDSLMNDFLTQVAGNFFEARRVLEDKIELFFDHVEQLKDEARRVDAHAVYLNNLLLDRQNALRFYESLSVAPEPFLVEGSLSSHSLPASVPFALSTKGRYQKLICAAYTNLRTACHKYLFGDTEADRKRHKDTGAGPVYLGLIRQMHAMVNQDIHNLNCHMSPSCTLQYAKSFDLQTSEKEKTFGRTSPGMGGMDEKLRFDPVDFDALDIKVFPELPAGTQVEAGIKKIAGYVYRQDRYKVKMRIDALRRFDLQRDMQTD